MIKQDSLESRVRLIYLGIGSNLGNRRKNIEKAKFRLLENHVKIIKLSSYYETLSWPNSSYPKFLNIILKTSTNLAPLKLLKICKNIEHTLGRKKKPKNAPRECDIDIIDYDNIKIEGDIILPHPRMHERNFVLFPLFEINKNWKHPISKNHIKTLITELSIKDIRSIKQI